MAQHPAEDTTAAGPFEDWPTGLGFEYFYGSWPGKRRTTSRTSCATRPCAEHPQTSGGTITITCEDLADDAIHWLRNTRRCRPINRSSCTGPAAASHGPHHIMKEWADRYAGKFDDGWDAYRQRVFERAKGRAGSHRM